MDRHNLNLLVEPLLVMFQGGQGGPVGVADTNGRTMVLSCFNQFIELTFDAGLLLVVIKKDMTAGCFQASLSSHLGSDAISRGEGVDKKKMTPFQRDS